MKTILAAALFAAVLAAALFHRFLWDQPAATAKPAADAPPALLADAAFLGSLRRAQAHGIAVVAPSSGLRGESVEKAYAYAAQLGIPFPREALDPAAVPYTANSDEQRLRLLADALADPATGVLWALRGGYGSGRLLEDLAALPVPPTEKTFVGYSDATFLHLYFQRLGWRTIHGAMFWEIGAKDSDPENFRRLAALLAGETAELVYDDIRPLNRAAESLAAPIRGIVVGGNLTCLAAAAGTPWAVDARGGILFLEDVKEGGYKIDRLLTQLRQSGALASASAVLLGTFTAGDEHTGYALKRFAESMEKPVFQCDFFGHGEKNYPLPFNVPAELRKAEANDGHMQLRIP